jgi:large subunit ribosomal protein L13
MKTYSPTPDQIEHRWYVLDAGGRRLGRVASEAATLLRGKHKPIFAPHMDTGDHVIIVNADKVELSAGKELKKFAYRHSGHPGGLTATRYDRLMAERPVFVIEKAIKGMLPKNRLGRAMFRKLHVVAGPEHPHAAQQPVALEVGERPAWTGFPEPPAPKVGPPTRKTAKAAPADEGDGSAAAEPAEQAAVEKPAATKPAAEPTTPVKEPAAKAKPAGKKPAAKKPAVKKPAVKKPTAKKPTAKKPTAKKPTAKKPAAKKSEE